MNPRPADPDGLKALEQAFAIARRAEPPASGKRERLLVCEASELNEGGVKIVRDGTASIGVFRINGEYYAIRNRCPHQGAELCRGRVGATHAPGGVHQFQPDLHGRVLRCPWHGWEFDIPSGKGLYDHRSRVKTYRCHVDAEGKLWVEL